MQNIIIYMLKNILIFILNNISIILVCVLSFTDVTLTYEQLKILKGKGMHSTNIEVNPIARWVMNNFSYPTNYIISVVSASFYLVCLIMLGAWFIPERMLFLIGVVMGMLIMVNINHMTNISDYNANKENLEYWQLTAQCAKIKKWGWVK